MPKISKVRIVNFNYNDGSRLIADELFDFSSREEDDALNVLINLANGGGKSVLVQLMMQPIIPRAKVAGRKIESFFTRLTDHCFVVLEWLKDNSREKLMTGIAIAAREIASTEEETSGGMGIKYYTFLANYTSDDAPCSLVSLPLSDRENGLYVPASYDAVKKIANKNKSMIRYYSSDDHPQWQRKLEEYGLIQDEWRMMEKLNSEEGGLGKFFGEFKNSDQLIDRLLIPTIEGKLRLMHSKEDSSLTTMLLSYAAQYAGQKEQLQKKAGYEQFRQGLTELKPMTEELWNEFSRQQDAEGVLFGISEALRRKELSLRTELMQIRTEMERIDGQTHHIHWEQKSEAFYSCGSVLQQETERWNKAAEYKQQLQERLNLTKRSLTAQECANYFSRLKECESRIRELQQEIRRRTEGSDSAKELAVLGYSAACAIREQRDLLAPQLQQYREQNTHAQAEILEKEEQAGRTTAELNREKSELDCLQGKREAMEGETDRAAELLDADLIRRLDGFYAEEELCELEAVWCAERDRTASRKTAAAEEQNRAAERLEQIPEEIAACGMEIERALQLQQKEQEKQDAYFAAEAQVQKICTEYNLNFALRFTDTVADQLRAEKNRHDAKYGEILRQLSLAEEAIRAAEAGYLHVLQEVIRYLNATGVTYTTGEKYLLDQVEAGKLSRSRCLSLLKNYPAAAYGIIMNEENIRKFFDYGREEWLPAMIPLFTYGQMESILTNEKQFSGSIAFYSESYFADREQYISRLRGKREQLLQKRELENRANLHLQEQIKILDGFLYSEDWLDQEKKKIAAISETIRTKNAEQEKRKAERDTLRQQQRLLAEEAEVLDRQMDTLRTRFSCLAELRQRMQKELDIGEQITQQRRKTGELQAVLSAQQKNLEEARQQKESLQLQLDRLEEQLRDLETAFAEVSERNADSRIEGEWKDLLERYRQLLQSRHEELAGLQCQLQEKEDQAARYREELDKRELPETEYSDLTYSAETERSLRRNRDELETALPPAEKEETTAYGEKCKAEGFLENAEKELSAFGDPLEKSEIGSDFESRLNTCQTRKAQLREKKESCEEQGKGIERTQAKLDQYTADLVRPEQIPEIELAEHYPRQVTEAISAHKQCRQTVLEKEHCIAENLELLRSRFTEDFPEVRNAIDRMKELLKNTLRGDRYFTLNTLAEQTEKSAALEISKIATDLKEIENFRSDIIHHCTLQGRRIFEGLQQMQSSSKVSVCEGKPKKEMIRFDFPDHADPVAAESAIADEIDQGTKELAECLADTTKTEADRKKTAERIVGSRNLLRKYLGKSSIQASAYKIDQNPENSGYRKWKDTQINNSGAEKFVVYFAVILSLINYTRGGQSVIQDRELRSVLILDNPFGATSSRHILVPMFSIARHFRVQMICLSDINKTDVINCFDIVIKALVKRRPMSSRELLTHEGNERIEHGYYRSEQISLL